MALDRLTQQILNQHQAHLVDLTEAVEANTATVAGHSVRVQALEVAARRTVIDRAGETLARFSAPVQIVILACGTTSALALLFLGALLASGTSPEAFALRFLDRAGEVLSAYGRDECATAPTAAPPHAPLHQLPPAGEAGEEAVVPVSPTEEN